MAEHFYMKIKLNINILQAKISFRCSFFRAKFLIGDFPEPSHQVLQFFRLRFSGHWWTALIYLKMCAAKTKSFRSNGHWKKAARKKLCEIDTVRFCNHDYFSPSLSFSPVRVPIYVYFFLSDQFYLLVSFSLQCNFARYS